MRRMLPLLALTLGLISFSLEDADAQLFPRLQRWNSQPSRTYQPSTYLQPTEVVRPACYGDNCPLVTLTSPDVPFSQPNVILNEVSPAPELIVKPIERIEANQTIDPVAQDDLIEGQILELEDWDRTAARCVVGNSCGSASLCGFYNGGTLFLTNAHVAGTRPGTACKIRMVVNGETKEYAGRTIMAAYSDKTLTDWCVVLVNEKIPVEPRKLSIDRPSGKHTTVGAPRCVWPLTRQNLTTVDIADGSPLWRWNPNSIGGQSGSGVWSLDDGLQYGLLTWSWGGYGAGQQTSEIYRQARQRSIAGEPRPEGLKELRRDPAVIVENGFFAQAGIDELPIWDDGMGGVEPPANALVEVLLAAFPEGADKCAFAESLDFAPYAKASKATLVTGVYDDFSEYPSLAVAWFNYAIATEESLPEMLEGLAHFKVALCSPEPESPSMDEDEKRLFQKLREINQARRAKREKAIDWFAVIQLILKLIELFGTNTSVENPDFAFDVRVIPTRAVNTAWQLAA